MPMLRDSLVCITGASSGIGTACAEAFAREGAALVLLARRTERLKDLAHRLASTYSVRVHAAELDVRRQKDVGKFFGGLGPDWKEIDILVNNAGLSRGLQKLQEGRLDDWEEMIDTNVKGLLYVTREVLPGMVARNRGHVINIGSIAGHQTYPGGNVYSATKFAVNGLSRSLKMDLLGTAVRVSSVDPGMVETEFSLVRFHGDTARAARTYDGMKPLEPADVADVVLFCATRPAHVNIGEIVFTPVDQASATLVHRTTT